MIHLPKPGEGGDFTPPPEGSFPAVAYRIVDLGTQNTTFQGQSKDAHKIMVSWEIQDEDAVMSDGQPMTIHQRYTWSMHEKATLRKHLEAWRGKKFTEDDFGPGGFDVRKLLGAPCMISIVHNPSGDKLYANVAGVVRLPKGLSTRALHNAKSFVWLERDEFDADAFEKLSEGLKTTIKKSPEYHELMRPGSGQEVTAARGGYSKEYGDEDKIPF